MTLTELRFLIALQEEQHFGRAAVACGVSQPALSSALRGLEEELGVLIFERSRAGVKATQVGREVVEQARKVIASAVKIQDLANSDGDHLSEPLTLGAIYTIAPYLLPQTLLYLQKQRSSLVLHPREDYNQCLLDRLRQGQLDAAIIASPLKDKEILTQPLYREPFTVMMPRGHVLAAQMQVAPDEIYQFPVLLPGEAHCLHHQIREALPGLQEAQRGHEPYYGGVETLDALRSLVAGGLGLAVLPMMAANTLCAGQNGLVTRTFSGPPLERNVALAWRISFPRHKAIDHLRQAILACGRPADRYTTEPESQEQGLLVQNRFW